MTEADEISQEDLQGASDYYIGLHQGKLPQQDATKIAKEQYGVELTDQQLNRILGLYACTPESMGRCVKQVLAPRNKSTDGKFT